MTFRQRLLRLLPPAATTLFFYPSYSVASCGLVKPTDKEALRRQQAAYVTAIYSGNASSRKMMAKEFPGCNPSTMEKWEKQPGSTRTLKQNNEARSHARILSYHSGSPALKL